MVHRAEVRLKVAHIKDSLLLALGPAKGLAGSSLGDLDSLIIEQNIPGVGLE